MNGSSTKHCEALLRLSGVAFLSHNTRRILKSIIADEKKRAQRGAPCDKPRSSSSAGDPSTGNEHRRT